MPSTSLLISFNDPPYKYSIPLGLLPKFFQIEKADWMRDAGGIQYYGRQSRFIEPTTRKKKKNDVRYSLKNVRYLQHRADL